MANGKAGPVILMAQPSADEGIAPVTTPTFRVRSKHLFVTWPRSDGISRPDIISLLQNLGAARWVVSTEQHSDGGRHHHALIGWDRVYDCTNARTFDVGGCHANIARVRNLRAAYRYARKDGDYDDTFCLDEGRGPFAEACGAADADEFLRIIEQKRPRDFVLYHDRLVSFANKRFKPEPEEHRPVHTEFVLPDDLAGWVATEFPKVLWRKRHTVAVATGHAAYAACFNYISLPLLCGVILISVISVALI